MKFIFVSVYIQETIINQVFATNDSTRYSLSLPLKNQPKIASSNVGLYSVPIIRPTMPNQPVSSSRERLNKGSSASIYLRIFRGERTITTQSPGHGWKNGGTENWESRFGRRLHRVRGAIRSPIVPRSKFLPDHREAGTGRRKRKEERDGRNRKWRAWPRVSATLSPRE